MKWEDAADITTPFGLTDDFSPQPATKQVEKVGPNSWAEVSLADFGCPDYELYPIGDNTVIYACSEACLQWCYRFLTCSGSGSLEGQGLYGRD